MLWCGGGGGGVGVICHQYISCSRRPAEFPACGQRLQGPRLGTPPNPKLASASASDPARHARPAPPPDVAQTKTSQTNSIVCLKNEILLRLRAGITGEQFKALLMKNRAMVLDGIPALAIYRLRLQPGANLAETLNSLAKDPLVLKTEPNQIYRSITPARTSIPYL